MSINPKSEEKSKKKTIKRKIPPDITIDDCPACGARGVVEEYKGKLFLTTCHPDDVSKCIKTKWNKICSSSWRTSKNASIYQWNRRQANYAALERGRQSTNNLSS